jgi:hypothetical protein
MHKYESIHTYIISARDFLNLFSKLIGNSFPCNKLSLNE